MQVMRDASQQPEFRGLQLRLRSLLRDPRAEIAIESTRWGKSGGHRPVSWVAFQIGRSGYRAPDADETGLSPDEILIGIRDGVIR